MIKKETVSKLIENRGNYQPETLKTLGSLEKLYAAADFYDRQPEVLELIIANELLTHAQNEQFNSDEFNAFSGGLTRFGLFFKECSDQRKLIEKNKIDIKGEEEAV